MIEWATRHPAVFEMVALVSTVAAIVFLVLWLRSAHNTRLLSAELDRADAAVAESRSTAVRQGARMQVIRELQDVTARGISAIASNADAVRYIADGDDGSPARAAARISDAARVALGDLRRLGTVAGDGALPGAGAPPLTVTLSAMEHAGLDIRLTERGLPFELAGGAEHAVDGIVADALGDVLRRGGTEVDLTLDWSEDGLRLQIDDDSGRRGGGIRSPDADAGDRSAERAVRVDSLALTAADPGDDLALLRERAEAFGGVVHTTDVPSVGRSVSVAFGALRHHNGVHGVPLTR